MCCKSLTRVAYVTYSRSRRRLWFGMGVVLVLIAAAAAGAFLLTRDERHVLEGTLEAPECGGGYAIENANVEVRDESNTLVGAGRTGPNTRAGLGRCRVRFTVDDLPKTDFYQVRIGTHDGPSYTFDEMQQAEWDLALTLGGDD
jgi:hypothetical protein